MARPFLLRLLRILLCLVPSSWRISIYKAWIENHRITTALYHNVYRLPFGLVLKTGRKYPHVEADALRFVNTLSGIHAPYLIDAVFDGNTTFLLTNWIGGDCVTDDHVWDAMTVEDWARLEQQLRSQLGSMRRQTLMSHADQAICNASGGPIDDPRIPWVARENPRIFTSSRDFAAEVWTGLHWPSNCDTLLPLLKPLIERDDVPIVFSHGDILPKNMILPGGLNCWRTSGEMVCIIDWEYAGWMPIFWDALKATWMGVDVDDFWMQFGRRVFPEFIEELEADWEWRSRSQVLIL
ncbi:protein kinase subdomain-containing protein PKL [Phlebopus sp. FC_14]|nr:protein kinase subdomain-containing protein PKL [Phlebopus sp. FC_14]